MEVIRSPAFGQRRARRGYWKVHGSVKTVLCPGDVRRQIPLIKGKKTEKAKEWAGDNTCLLKKVKKMGKKRQGREEEGGKQRTQRKLNGSQLDGGQQNGDNRRSDCGKSVGGKGKGG